MALALIADAVGIFFFIQVVLRVRAPDAKLSQHLEIDSGVWVQEGWARG